MSVIREQKQAVVEEIKDKISKAKSVVFINYQGISVADDTELRNKFRESNVEYRVYKNRLLLRALNDLGIEGFEEVLQGTTSVAFDYEEETNAARIAYEYESKKKVLELKSGILNNAKIEKDFVTTLAKLPTKPQLIGQLLSVLNGPIRGVAIALKAIAEKKQENN